MSKYAIEINEDHLPLIAHLNDGVTPLVEENQTYFLFTVMEDHTVVAEDIVTENDLYDDLGHLKDIDRDILF